MTLLSSTSSNNSRIGSSSSCITESPNENWWAQEATETIPQVVIRFRNPRHQLTRPPVPEDLTEIILITLHEPLHTTLAVIDFTGKTCKDVIDRVLWLDSRKRRRVCPWPPSNGLCQRRRRHKTSINNNPQLPHMAVEMTLPSYLFGCSQVAYREEENTFISLDRLDYTSPPP